MVKIIIPVVVVVERVHADLALYILGITPVLAYRQIFVFPLLYNASSP